MVGLGAKNLFLRMATSASRFILLAFLARVLGMEDLGRYGLIVVTITFAVFGLGLEFHIFNAREILKRESSEWPPLIRDQLVLHGIIYCIGLPGLVVVFLLGLLPWSVAPWLYVLLIGEHLCAEVQRLLVTMSRPLHSNLVMFLRSAAWVYALAPVQWFVPETRHLTAVLLAWLIGIVAALATAWPAFCELDWHTCRGTRVDRAWIWRGLRIALPFLIAAVALQATRLVDRYVLQHHWGDASVGVLVFFAGIANLLVVFADNGVLRIVYPRLVSAFQRGKTAEYREMVRKLAVGIVVIAVSLTAIIAITIGWFLEFIGKPILAQSLDTLWVLLGASAVFLLSYVPQYVLYARGADAPIMLSRIAGLVVAVVANLALVPAYGTLGTAYAGLLAMATITAVETAFAVLLKPKPPVVEPAS